MIAIKQYRQSEDLQSRNIEPFDVCDSKPPIVDTTALFEEALFFELRGPQNLFGEIQQAVLEYDREPSSRLLLFLLFSLNHLPEWIAGESAEKLRSRQRAGEQLWPNQQFFLSLWQMPEFRTVNALCNRSKHYQVRRPAATSVTKGMTCESPCTDSLDQGYYRIDGVDTRKIFLPLVRSYHDWFATHG